MLTFLFFILLSPALQPGNTNPAVAGNAVNKSGRAKGMAFNLLT
jgi:hypothetical protein